MPLPWTTSASATISGTSITLVEGPAFCISDRAGNMAPDLPHGLFFRDTRFLSLLQLRVNGAAPEPLAATTPDPFSGVYVLRDHPRPGRADSNLMVFRHRYVGRGMREDIVVHNFSEEPAFCAIELVVGCDFADLFEVKEGRVEKVGDLSVTAAGSRITFQYRRGAFRRAAHVDFSPVPQIRETTVTYEVIVPARGDWTTCLQLTPVIDEHEITPRYLCGESVERTTPVERLGEWRRRLPKMTSDHDQFRGLLERSSAHRAALRIFDPDYPDRAVVAAGAPWFMTLFGRDSLLTSWMTMIVDPDLALGTLETLARFQGTEVNPLTEEEPGRILHEMRFGETAALSLGGGRVYYGTVDATPLFVMLLGELSRWGNRREDVDALLPAADRALDWITNYGDRDGDGYVEYQRTNDRGLENQGWKDSWDSTRFKDGTLAQTPIAV
jgi:glycogen debranching enzyme